MLGKVVVVAGAGAAYLLRTRAGQQQAARLLDRVRSLQAGGTGAATTVADRRPQAAIEHRPAPPVLLPDATPVEVARAVLAEQPRT
jgi:hypothetical protein